MRAIKQYGAELTRKKDELFRIDIDSNITSVVSRKQLYNQKSCLKLFGQTYARQKVWGQSWLQSGILQWP